MYFQPDGEKRIFLSRHVMFYLLYKPNHFTFIVFAAKRATYFVAIVTVIFSHVKLTCYLFILVVTKI